MLFWFSPKFNSIFLSVHYWFHDFGAFLFDCHNPDLSYAPFADWLDMFLVIIELIKIILFFFFDGHQCYEFGFEEEWRKVLLFFFRFINSELWYYSFSKTFFKFLFSARTVELWKLLSYQLEIFCWPLIFPLSLCCYMPIFLLLSSLLHHLLHFLE